jgi:pSer/pThr/pTyr-binding forkhead associated (FHA) protein
MPKLILQFENRVLKEYPVGLQATVGRLPDNTVIIDNPAVSSHHACIVRDGDNYILEDLQSRNGTFVNGQRVSRQALQGGDVVLVGKHTLVFDQNAAEPVASGEPQLSLSGLGDTSYLDTRQHKALLTKLTEATAQTAPATGAPSMQARAAAAAPPAKPAVLRALTGRGGQSEYRLESRTSLIGASEDALIRLHGWFAPKVAVAIALDGDGYVATPLTGKTLVNGEQLKERYRLKDGDILSVSGLVLEFHSNA